MILTVWYDGKKQKAKMQNILLKNGNGIHSFIVSKRLLGGDEGQRGLKFLYEEKTQNTL